MSLLYEDNDIAPTPVPHTQSKLMSPDLFNDVKRNKIKRLSEKERLHDQLDYLRSVMIRKMITYIKVHDVETCLNALFVLSGAQVSLE